MDETLTERAKAGAAEVVAHVASDSPPEHVAAMAWLAGYAAGHKAAMEFATATLKKAS